MVPAANPGRLGRTLLTLILTFSIVKGLGLTEPRWVRGEGEASGTVASTHQSANGGSQGTNVSPAAVPIGFGQTVPGSIEAPGQVDTYTFTADAGDEVLVRMSRDSADLWPGIRVYDQHGVVLCEAGASTTAEIASCSLSASGAYSILTFDSFNGTRTGDYYIYLQRLNKPDSVEPIAFGQTLSGSIVTPAQMDTYTFSANPGAVILVRMTKAVGDVWPGIRVYSPDGIKLCEASASSSAEIPACALESWGTYSILTLDSFSGTRTGDYHLYLQQLAPGVSLERIDVAPSTVTLLPGETQQFTATCIDSFDNPVACEPSWSVADPAAGTIDEDGLFTAGTGAGSYPAAVVAAVDILTGTAYVTVEPDAENPVAVTIDPDEVTLVAGQCQSFSLTGWDAYYNLFDVTDGATFVVDGGGTLTHNEFCADTAGDWRVTATYQTVSAEATVTVEPDVENPVAVTIDPDQVTLVAGQCQSFSLTARDAYDNLFDVTDVGTFVVDGGGTLTHNEFCVYTVGVWTVTGTYLTVSAEATVTVPDMENPVAVTIDPDQVTLAEGQCQAFSLTARDAFDTSWDATDDALFTVDGGGTLTHNEFCADTVGMWTVAGRFLDLSADAKVEVTCRPPEIVALTANSPVTLGKPMQFTATVEATEPITYTWDFGDGGAGALLAGGEETATYLFAEPGTYTVTLTVENDGGSDTAGVVAVVKHLIYLPLALRDHVSHFAGPWEVEPNNTWQQANGPLVSGRAYYGYPNDARDFFSIYTRRPGQITVNLTGHTGQGVQLQLFRGPPLADGSNRVGFVAQSPYQITHTGPAGWYYIYIYTESGHNEHTPYTLRVTYPE